MKTKEIRQTTRQRLLPKVFESLFTERERSSFNKKIHKYIGEGEIEAVTFIRDFLSEFNKLKKNYMTVPAAIRELEKIEMIRYGNSVYKLDHALSKTQKNILSAFDIDTNYMKKELGSLSIELEAIEKNGKKSDNDRRED